MAIKRKDGSKSYHIIILLTILYFIFEKSSLNTIAISCCRNGNGSSGAYFKQRKRMTHPSFTVVVCFLFCNLIYIVNLTPPRRSVDI